MQCDLRGVKATMREFGEVDLVLINAVYRYMGPLVGFDERG